MAGHDNSNNTAAYLNTRGSAQNGENYNTGTCTIRVGHGTVSAASLRRTSQLDPNLFGTHSLRRTKATLIYRRTGNLRAVQLLLGHTKIESTVRYLGIEVDDALAIAEQVDV